MGLKHIGLETGSCWSEGNSDTRTEKRVETEKLMVKDEKQKAELADAQRTDFLTEQYDKKALTKKTRNNNQMFNYYIKSYSLP